MTAIALLSRVAVIVMKNGGYAMLSEFKKFLMRGNVMDLAVGIIIGGAFQGIVNSLVNDIINPILSIFLTKVDFKSLSYSIPGTAAVIGYGSLITAIINFVIMGGVIFLIVKACNKLAERNKREEIIVVTTKICPYCLSEIHKEAKKCPHCTSVLED